MRSQQGHDRRIHPGSGRRRGLDHPKGRQVDPAALDEVLALLGTLPPAKRQPNLLFGVVRLLGGPVDSPAAFHEFVVGDWPAIAAHMRIRATQTNEAGRCALLLPVLAALPQPLALLEVGTSAGLCLYPDRYAYRYNDVMVGSGAPVLDGRGGQEASVGAGQLVPGQQHRAGDDRVAGKVALRCGMIARQRTLEQRQASPLSP